MSLNVKTRKVDGVIVIDMSGRLTIGEPVPHRFSHAPFRRSQEVVVTRPTAGLICWHGLTLPGRRPIYPTIRPGLGSKAALGTMREGD